MTTATHSELELEAIRICQELIRIPSVNYGEGKGDEKDVAAHVVKLLSEVGIVSQTYESAPGRCNVIARIKGSNPNRPGLVVHGHLDVVPVNAADWSVDPFSAEIKDGFIWGRGAVDMKNMDAMIIATVRDWARTGYVPERDIVLAFFADEEAGSNFGSHYMVKNHPEVFAGCTEAVSEVGGFSVTVAGGKRLYLIETAEKGIHWMRLTADGRAGHGSMMNGENAVTRLAEAVAKIGHFQWPQRYSNTVKAFFKRIAEETGKPYNEDDLRPLLKEIGFASKGTGSTDAGLAAVKETLVKWKLDKDVQLFDGSGLASEGRVPCDVFMSLLDIFSSSMPNLMAVAGESGTLRETFDGTAVAGLLRGKTGTLNGVKALVGYVPVSNSGPVSFALLMNKTGIDNQGSYRPIWYSLADVLNRASASPSMEQLTP